MLRLCPLSCVRVGGSCEQEEGFFSTEPWPAAARGVAAGQITIGGKLSVDPRPELSCCCDTRHYTHTGPIIDTQYSYLHRYLHIPDFPVHSMSWHLLRMLMQLCVHVKSNELSTWFIVGFATKCSWMPIIDSLTRINSYNLFSILQCGYGTLGVQCVMSLPNPLL